MAFQANCQVSKTDLITAYITDQEVATGKRLAVVVESTWGNKQEKASVILTKEDAVRFRELLNEFIDGPAHTAEEVEAASRVCYKPVLDVLPAENLAHLLMKDV